MVKTIFHEVLSFLVITINLLVALHPNTGPYSQAVHLALAIWFCFLYADLRRWGEDIEFWTPLCDSLCASLCASWANICEQQRNFYTEQINKLIDKKKVEQHEMS